MQISNFEICLLIFYDWKNTMIIPKKELVQNLIKIYSFGYITKEADNGNKEIIDSFAAAFKKNVTDRISIIYDLANYIAIEENYVEPEWKEMIANHYVHSAYSSTLKQSVIRIHFLSQKDFSEENYLGFITLRPLEEIAIALSFIYVNWKHKIYSNRVSYVMTYQKEIHFMGKSIMIETYPFFAQDSIVTCCADANVIMLAKYFNNKFNLTSTEKMGSVFKKPSKIHRLPKRVDSTLLQDMLTNIGISFRMLGFCHAKEFDDDKWYMIQKYIDAYIESGLPVILGIDGHVVQLIGHINNIDDIDRKYIVYDDSGHLEKLCLEKCEKNKHKFSYILNINNIKEYFRNAKSDNFFILLSEHERVYIDFERYQFFLTEYLLQYSVLDDKNESIISHIFSENKVINDNVHFRTMLVDNSILKCFLMQQKSKEQEKLINKLLKRGLTHYLWYTEINVDNKKFCLCADPTMYYNTIDIEKLFLFATPIAILDNNNTLSLLTKNS